LDRFADEQATVPSLWHLELANALAVSEPNRRITRANSSEFIALIRRLPLIVDETTPSLALRAVLDLARSEGLSAYDASNLELAMRRGVPLATKDDALAQAARRLANGRRSLIAILSTIELPNS
jgi:predicted nucleic acid-binding protein